LTGIEMTTVGSGYALPSVSAARYASGPQVCQRNNRPASSDASAAKSVHFNTVHNCQQLDADRPPPRLSNIDEAPGQAITSSTAAGVGQSLPASYRYHGMSADPHKPAAIIQPSTPTATINRHYAVQPRTLYRPGLDTQPVATVCRSDGGGDHGCPGNGPRSLRPQCTISDDSCVSTPASRLRHYCV